MIANRLMHSNTARIAWLDGVKALAMILVYLGHVLEKLHQKNGFESALLPWQLIYSFHLPLFFILAGLLAKPQYLNICTAAIEKARTRLLPLLFFSLLILPAWWYLGSAEQCAHNASMYRYGLPAFNLPSWFLLCLFMVEIEILLLFRILPPDHSWQTLLSAALFFAIGYLLAPQLPLIAARLQVPAHSWFIYESLIAAGFYLVGYSSRQLIVNLPRTRWLALVTICAALLWYLAACGNPVPFFRVVLLVASAHGNYGLFLLAALSGSVMTITLLRLCDPDSRSFTFIARNSLIYLGLNGFFFHFIDDRVFTMIGFIPDRPWAVIGFAGIYVAATMLLLAPIVMFLRRFFGWWLGIRTTATQR
ncbi:MAG TPA: acyltransferase family protein [Spongiibacteraceae bacterium]|nr:acyltransferase family protein [Spongiibacteraceae bacterium]